MYINVTKNATGMGYRYSDLLNVAKAVTDAGIEFRQHTIWSAEADSWVVETKVKFPGEDKFGDWDSPVPIIAGAKMSRQGKRILSDMQEYQSAQTSARRYSLQIATNAIPDDDDVRNAGTSNPSGIQNVEAERGGVTNEQCVTMVAEAKAKGLNAAAICKQATGTNLSSPMQLTADQYAQVMNIIREA
jgi:hypothetical protein